MGGMARTLRSQPSGSHWDVWCVGGAAGLMNLLELPLRLRVLLSAHRKRHRLSANDLGQGGIAVGAGGRRFTEPTPNDRSRPGGLLRSPGR